MSLNGSSPSRTSPDGDGETRFDVLVAGGAAARPERDARLGEHAGPRRHGPRALRPRGDRHAAPCGSSRCDPAHLAVDGVLVVIRANKTRRDDAEELRDQLEKLNAPVTGIVFNGLKQTGDPYGYGYYARPHSEREPDGRSLSRLGRSRRRPRYRLRITTPRTGLAAAEIPGFLMGEHGSTSVGPDDRANSGQARSAPRATMY